MTDHDLLRSYLQDHDVDSLDVFVRRHQKSLVRFAVNFLGDSEAAQDVVQETFLRVARHPRRLLKVDSCHNWLLRVVRNVGIDHIRRVTRRRRHTQAAAEQVTEVARQRQVEPSAEVERAEIQAQLETEVDDLKDRYRRGAVGEAYSRTRGAGCTSPCTYGFTLLTRNTYKLVT